MPAKYTITKDDAGKYRFTLYGTTGQVITTSGPYATRRGALIGLAAVRRNAVQETAKSTSTAKRTAKPAAKRRSSAR